MAEEAKGSVVETVTAAAAPLLRPLGNSADRSPCNRFQASTSCIGTLTRHHRKCRRLHKRMFRCTRILEVVTGVEAVTGVEVVTGLEEAATETAAAAAPLLRRPLGNSADRSPCNQFQACTCRIRSLARHHRKCRRLPNSASLAQPSLPNMYCCTRILPLVEVAGVEVAETAGVAVATEHPVAGVEAEQRRSQRGEARSRYSPFRSRSLQPG